MCYEISLFPTNEIIQDRAKDRQEDDSDNPEHLLFAILVATENIHNNNNIDDYDHQIK